MKKFSKKHIFLINFAVILISAELCPVNAMLSRSLLLSNKSEEIAYRTARKYTQLPEIKYDKRRGQPYYFIEPNNSLEQVKRGKSITKEEIASYSPAQRAQEKSENDDNIVKSYKMPEYEKKKQLKGYCIEDQKIDEQK